VKSTIHDNFSSLYLINDSIPWLAPENKSKLDLLYLLAEDASIYGLNNSDYILPLKSDLPGIGKQALINNQICAVAIHFFESLAYGNQKPLFGYNSLDSEPCRSNIALILRQYFDSDRLQVLADSLNKGSLPLLKKIRGYLVILNNPGFREILVVSKKADLSNNALKQKLYQLGFLNEAEKADSTDLKKAIIAAQKSFDLIADGTIRSTFIEQLNVPVRIRYNQCKQALNDLRWLSCITGSEETILVNIPGAFMEVYNKNVVTLNMRMVVGKASTPTPAFTSRIQEVILYPYWHVPRSIATKELLPLIKLSPAFIDKGGYQVLNGRGEIMDPYRIKWHTLSTSNFPYLIRQSTGCDNALGLIKLNFFSPYGVYLHDTPSRNSFSLHRRYFSHGCMRMEKPMELGRLILKENSIAIDTITAKGCLTNQSPVTIKALHRLPLVVWYNVAAIDTSGSVIFYEDVYKKFK
jgi:hypothetical protein